MKKKLKVLYITNSGFLSGAAIALKNIFEQLDSKIEVFIIFPYRGDFSEWAEKHNYHCYYFKYRLNIYPPLRKKKDFIFFLPRLIFHPIREHIAYVKTCKLLARIKPDIIHTNVGPIHFGAKVAKKYDIPHIWHLREYQTKDFRMQPFPSFPSFPSFIKKLNSYGNHKVAITQEIASYFHTNSDTRVIFDGVVSKNQKIPEINLNTDNYFLFVGRLEAAKGWQDALNAFIEIADAFPLSKMVFAGSYRKDEIESVKRNVIPKNLLNRIEFLGFRDDRFNLMQNASAIIVPSISEGFGFITAEAMYNGCLVIGRNTSGTKEQFDNGLNFFGKEIGFRFNNQEELTEKMRSVMSAPKKEFIEMLENAQSIVLKLYSSEQCAENVYQYYIDCLENKNG